MPRSRTSTDWLRTPMRSARPDVVALPQAFKLAGWHTKSIGKIYHTAQGNVDDTERVVPCSVAPPTQSARPNNSKVCST